MKTLAANLSAYGPLRGFYKGHVTCNDGKIALIFTSDELLQELQKSTELYMDGTFNVMYFNTVYYFYILEHSTFINNNFLDCSTCAIDEPNVYSTYPTYECSKY